MFNKLSVNTLLKTVIAVLAMAAVAVMAKAAWNSWARLKIVEQVAVVTDASADLFTALHNLRVDRSYTTRELKAEKRNPVYVSALKQLREADLPAMKSALTKLKLAEFSDKQGSLAKLSDAVAKLATLHRDTMEAFEKPVGERRPGIADEYFKETGVMLKLFDAISDRLIQSVNLADPYVDRLLDMKELAWMARDAGGDNAILITNGISGLPVPKDVLRTYIANDTKITTAWTVLQNSAANMTLPAYFKAALANSKQEYFGREFTELRGGLIRDIANHQDVQARAAEWSKNSVPKLGSLLAVAEAALRAGKDYAAEQHTQAVWTVSAMIGLLAVTIAAALGLMVLVTRRVTKPLRAIQGAMLKLAEGDFSVVLPGLERKDEIGDVANAVERFKVLAEQKARAEAAEAVRRQQAEADRQAQLARAESEAQAKVAEERAMAAEDQGRAVNALAEGLRKLSAGELSYRLTVAFPDAYKELQDNFNATMQQLQETIGSLAAAAREVTNASLEISTSTTDLSQRTEEQAASLEETSASMEEIAATVKKNADNAQQANQAATGTREVAGRGGEVVAQAVQAMARIEESSRNISDIIGVIDEIARQTNLLALNAAVEAARAGDAGRGFAVVASEVRSLAQRSSQAAKDITDLIVNSNGQVKEGVDLVNRAGAALSEITQSIKQVADLVSDIAAASTEQSTGIEQINRALNQMDEATQQNSALVEENAATAKTLEHQAKAMDERIAFFRLNDNAAPSYRMAAGADFVPAAAAAVPAKPAPVKAGATPKKNPIARMQNAIASAWKDF